MRFWFVGDILRWMLDQIYALTGNYGWAVVIFTLVIRILLLPLDIKSRRSMKRMQAVQPKIDAINKKYADDREKLQRKTAELYKAEKISPLRPSGRTARRTLRPSGGTTRRTLRPSGGTTRRTLRPSGGTAGRILWPSGGTARRALWPSGRTAGRLRPSRRSDGRSETPGRSPSGNGRTPAGAGALRADGEGAGLQLRSEQEELRTPA